MSRNLQIILSGVRFHGDWNEICKLCEEIKHQLTVPDIPEKIITRYHNWKPEESDTQRDFEMRTIFESSINKSQLEKDYGGIFHELKGASSDIVNIGRKVYNYKLPDEEIHNIFTRIGRFIASLILGSFRSFEESVYKNIMLRTNAYYFNTEYFSISITDNKKELDFKIDVPKQKFNEDTNLGARLITAAFSTSISFKNKKKFTVQLNVFDKKLREKIQENLEEACGWIC